MLTGADKARPETFANENSDTFVVLQLHADLAQRFKEHKRGIDSWTALMVRRPSVIALLLTELFTTAGVTDARVAQQRNHKCGD